ncbi:MAG: hypothetical protein ISEC1_P1533 [Thiomicrorhabdus sp.]|nr:MAG: hypothetical protein ISEC1_P1533 [Thiomicrorhabdus sp.]
MNDLQFQKQIQINPFELDEAMQAYIQKHPELKKMVKKSREFNQQLEQAFDVEIPESLEARILMKQSYLVSCESDEESKANSHDDAIEQATLVGQQTGLSSGKATVIPLEPKVLPWWGLGGIAASFLVVTVLFNLWQAPASLASVNATDYVAHIVDHMKHDPELMTTFKPPSSEQELQNLFAAVGASIEQPMSNISYAGECVVNGQKGLHIVMQQNGEPVTVIIMPGQHIAAIEAFETRGYQGELLPVKGGVVAVVANNLEQVALAHMRFFKAIKFV